MNVASFDDKERGHAARAGRDVLSFDASPGPHRTVRHESADIEERAVEQIGRMLDPSLSAEERERRTRRLIEGPPEFSKQRIDLPNHGR
jgi:hypothetical protein